jgi:hypothetical protein
MRQQHDPRPQHRPLRRRGPTRQALQLRALTITKANNIRARRHAHHGAATRVGHDGRMAKPPESTKTSLRQRLAARERERWPRLSGINIHWHGQFANIAGQLPGGTSLPLCRPRYTGSGPDRLDPRDRRVIVALERAARGDLVGSAVPVQQRRHALGV